MKAIRSGVRRAAVCGSALPLVLVAITLSQVAIARQWRNLSTEIQLLGVDLQADYLRRLALACTLSQDSADLQQGQSTRQMEGPDSLGTIQLVRSATEDAALAADGQSLLLQQCSAGSQGRQAQARSWWLLSPPQPPRLLSVLEAEL